MKKALCFLFSAACLWAADAVPRPEFPEPQFQREQWLNLNGRWEFEFDDANAGLAENWAAGVKKFTRNILVPYCFESKLSGIADTSYHPWAWYRRAFTTPAEWKGRRLLLHFGAVDYRAMVWVNGKFAGNHEGGFTPFVLDITPLAAAGSNVIVVRAEDPPTDRSIPRGKQYWGPKSQSIWYTRSSGIWQTVWIEPVAETHLESVRITPTTDGVVRFEPRIEGATQSLEFHAIIRSANVVVGSAMTRVGGRNATLITGVASPRLWTAERPTLYDVVFELRRGTEVVDRVSSYFGFRSVSTENGRLLLNGSPIYFKSVLDQGFWPESVLTPPTDEAIQYDIKMTKEMGFNGARKHQKVEDPRYLYWADRLGFLVSGEMANAQVFDEGAVERFTKEWMDVVQRDYNHPSVIIWAPINESWGVPDVARDVRQQNYIKSLYALTKTLDSTRLVIDNEGWEHTAMTDLYAVHNYARTGDLLYEAYKDMGGKPGERVPRLVPGAVYNGSPFYLSEFGGIAYIPPGANVPAEAWGYSGVEKTADDALARMRGLYEALRKMPNFIGICYTQLTDVEQEINGLMTYDRKPKFDSKALRDLNQMLR
jgi:beta-galactosidase/beta-glucuronidase